jgi:dynein heavy chain
VGFPPLEDTMWPFSPFKGEMTLSPDVEAMQSVLSHDRVPDTWSKLAYPSTYGLAQW